MTTTARDGSFKTENIFAPFLRQPWASGRGERGGDYQTWGPLLSSGWSLKLKFTNSPDWWDQIRCQNYKLPHSSLLVRAHDISPHQTVCSKNNSRQQKNQLTHVFTCFWKSGPWLLGGRWGCSSPRNLSVFSFVFCILGGGAMNDGYKWDEEAHMNLFTTYLTCFSHQHFYTTCIQNLWIFLVFVLGFFTTFLSSYMAFNLDPKSYNKKKNFKRSDWKWVGQQWGRGGW